MLNREALGKRQRSMQRQQKRKSKGGETPKGVFHNTLQGQRISTSMRLTRIRRMIVAGASYSAIAFFAGIPKSRLPRIIAEIRRNDKAEISGRFAPREELPRKAASGGRMDQ